MLFNSVQYWAFFAAVMIILAFCRPTLTRLIIVVASYIFYSFWDPRFTLLLFASTISNYLFGIAINDASHARRKPILIASVALNLGVLGFFKYFDFFAGSLSALLGIPSDQWILHVLLPVGVSFFTFEGIAYCIEIGRAHV